MASHRPPDILSESQEDGVRRARLNSFPPRRYSFEALIPALNGEVLNNKSQQKVLDAVAHSRNPTATAQITLDDGEREYFHADTLGEKLIHRESLADAEMDFPAMERSNSFPMRKLSLHRNWELKSNSKPVPADEEPADGPQHANGRVPSPTSASSRFAQTNRSFVCCWKLMVSSRFQGDRPSLLGTGSKFTVREGRWGGE